MNNNESFEKSLEYLLDEIGNFPSGSVNNKNKLLKLARKHHKSSQDQSVTIQKSLDDLRVLTKYLLFDLEATRRENVYFRKLLGEKGT